MKKLERLALALGLLGATSACAIDSKYDSIPSAKLTKSDTKVRWVASEGETLESKSPAELWIYFDENDETTGGEFFFDVHSSSKTLSLQFSFSDVAELGAGNLKPSSDEHAGGAVVVQVEGDPEAQVFGEGKVRLQLTSDTVKGNVQAEGESGQVAGKLQGQLVVHCHFPDADSDDTSNDDSSAPESSGTDPGARGGESPIDSRELAFMVDDTHSACLEFLQRLEAES